MIEAGDLIITLKAINFDGDSGDDHDNVNDDNITEMPTSGDLNRETVFFLPPPPPPPRKLTQPPMGMGTLYDVLHDVHTIKSRMLEMIFVNDKNAPETVLRIRKIQVLS